MGQADGSSLSLNGPESIQSGPIGTSFIRAIIFQVDPQKIRVKMVDSGPYSHLYTHYFKQARHKEERGPGFEY